MQIFYFVPAQDDAYLRSVVRVARALAIRAPSRFSTAVFLVARVEPGGGGLRALQQAAPKHRAKQVAAALLRVNPPVGARHEVELLGMLLFHLGDDTPGT